MQIEQSTEFKTVTDYEFSFNNGVRLPLTIDAAAGDTVEVKEDRYVVSLSAKPKVSNPDIKLPAEIATVFNAALAWVVVRIREERIPSMEDKLNLMEQYKKISKTIQ